MSSDGTRIGSLKQVVELRARIAELEAELAAERERRAAHAVVTWFAGVMEECLRDNDHKDGWSHCSQRFLLTRLFEEAFELKAAIESGALPVEIEREAADVANFAMMIADVCGGDGRRTHDEKAPT